MRPGHPGTLLLPVAATIEEGHGQAQPADLHQVAERGAKAVPRLPLTGAPPGAATALDDEQTQPAEDHAGSLGEDGKPEPQGRPANSPAPAALAVALEVVTQGDEESGDANIGRGQRG